MPEGLVLTLTTLIIARTDAIHTSHRPQRTAWWQSLPSKPVMEAAVLAQMLLDDDDAEEDEELLLAAVLEEAQQNPFLHRRAANSYSRYDHRSTFQELLERFPYEGDRWKSQFRVHSLR
jgi:hypothetical protein